MEDHDSWPLPFKPNRLGHVFVVKAGPKYELLATNSMGKALMATPALSDGMLILRAENYVYAISEDTTGVTSAIF